jgi:hypothetical protein
LLLIVDIFVQIVLVNLRDSAGARRAPSSQRLCTAPGRGRARPGRPDAPTTGGRGACPRTGVRDVGRSQPGEGTG